jgi:hypothetical protein
MLISHVETKDKQVDRLLGLINNRNNLIYFCDFVKQLKQNFDVLVNGEKDNAFFERQREILFEIVFLIKSIMDLKLNPLKFVNVGNQDD